MTVDIGSGSGNSTGKGVVIHILQHVGSFNKGRVVQTVGIKILAAKSLGKNGVPQHGGPGIVAGHLAAGIEAGVLDVLQHLNKLITGGGEMIPASFLQDLGIVDDGEDGRLKRKNADLAVYSPGIKGTVGEVFAPTLIQIRGQVHELAGFGIGLDIKGGVENAEIGGRTGGDGGTDLITVGLVVGLLFNDNLDGTGILGCRPRCWGS